ncbi:hypothetical protein [Antarctobacter jejuensis]|uniref:hypothetical protein n=1 Tax=Antarctobacter jejuensis TaxID=1439938 RepID=UPI003FD436F6
MDRLSWYISLLVFTVVSGALIVTFLAVEWYSWNAIALSVILGLVAARPFGRLISRRIKRDDPQFDPPKIRPGLVPDPKAPEV